MTTPEHSNRLRFDPTINAGHMITFAGFLISGAMAYGNLDKRILLVEQRATTVEQRLAEKDARMTASLEEIKRDVRETNAAVNILAREIAKGKP